MHHTNSTSDVGAQNNVCGFIDQHGTLGDKCGMDIWRPLIKRLNFRSVWLSRQPGWRQSIGSLGSCCTGYLPIAAELFECVTMDSEILMRTGMHMWSISPVNIHLWHTKCCIHMCVPSHQYIPEFPMKVYHTLIPNHMLAVHQTQICILPSLTYSQTPKSMDTCMLSFLFIAWLQNLSPILNPWLMSFLFSSGLWHSIAGYLASCPQWVF